jgi:hypothetical protein
MTLFPIGGRKYFERTFSIDFSGENENNDDRTEQGKKYSILSHKTPQVPQQAGSVPETFWFGAAVPRQAQFNRGQPGAAR